MRHQPFQLRVRRRRERRHNLRRRRARAQAAHPGIDLEVIAHRLSGRRGEPVEIAHLRERVHGRRQIVLHQRRLFERQEPAHHQNARRGHAGGAQGRAFIHRTHRQPARAFRGQNPRDFDGAVAVCIGLHHAQDVHSRPNHRADVAIIARDLAARHQHERTKWSRHCFHSSGRACNRSSGGDGWDRGKHSGAIDSLDCQPWRNAGRIEYDLEVLEKTMSSEDCCDR